MYLEVFVAREALGYFAGKTLAAADQTIFGYYNSDLPGHSAIRFSEL
jgi:hypothetical protein